jgi:hypothetical protein
MAEYAVMPAADYKDACDAVREKTGGTEKIKSGELGNKIRSISGGGGGGVLPPGYTLLEYIKSSGTQHINTKFVPNSNSRVVVTVKFDSDPTTHAGLFGSRTGTKEQFWCYYRYNDFTFAARYGTNPDIKISAKPKEKNVVEMDRNTLVVNGEVVEGSAQTFAGPYELYLFSVNQSGATQNTASFRLYSCRIYDNNVLVRDYLPCRNPENEVGLYDTVTEEFYGNAGEGAFDGSAGGTVPIGTKQITENGIYDVTGYATAEVAVPAGGAVADPVVEPLEVTENGAYIAPDGVDGYSPVTVNVPIPDGYIVPSGELEVIENGTHDVTAYASVNVNVEASGGGSEEEWIGDGNTHIWIRLEEGRTSPVLGVCPDGTVTVDWGDGTTPDTLTGTDTTVVAWTSTHNYASPGDYIITLTVDGRMGFYGAYNSNQGSGILRYSSSGDDRNYVYRNAVRKIEIGSGVTSIGNYAFCSCYGLTSIAISDSVTSIGSNAFGSCYGLTSIAIPESVTSIGSSTFTGCHGLTSIAIPKSVTSIGSNAFSSCHGLTSIAIPDGVTSVGNSMFASCYGLTSIAIPKSVTSIGNSAFGNCNSLVSIAIPKSVTSIGSNAFYNCYSLGKLRFNQTKPPNVSNSNAFTGIPTDCIISVPVASLGVYMVETNYPSASEYTYVEE